MIPYIVDKPSNIIKTENIIAAGGSKAQLILSDGKVVDLGDGAKKQLSDGDGIIDVNDKTVSYQNSSLAKDNSADIAYNTVKTPRGGEYNLKLSDGTVVWLNSESELKYPVSFAGKNRMVRVKGEAFFKVQKDAKRPFFVKTDDGLVRVLGTSFNIRNYYDEKSSVTTLVEGSISMKTANEELILKPGEQALVAEDGKVDVKDVDTDVYTAWKDGRFVFRRQTLSEMMNTLSRWYDVNVFFEDNDSKRVLFTGNIERYDDFQKIIDMVEMMKKVEFKVKGNNIWIRRVKE